ncbi:hypothetical protein CANINC_001040 [Pichia inconspicua]|uniref:t-SNARE coiled-coil homology domain-containing protein n=1 Tax=Pichia inconspicua TaxID=52247 RepID=A0A4T0X4I4_9ASCO|nr:hypothetical protein CANINC_001040 [[Candida] inconspicua]
MGKFETRITGTTEVGDYIVYDIDIRLSFQKFKFKEFKISKRFSDFIKFRKTLLNLGYSFVPKLPSRYTTIFKNKNTIIQERKEGLIIFSDYVLNDPELREIDEVLLFYRIPKSDINELKANNKVTEKNSEIDSSTKWMEIYKRVKSNIQNARIRVNSTNNLNEVESLVDSGESDLNSLKEYLDHSIELSNEEIKRRNQLLNSLSTEISDIKNMIKIIKPTSIESNESNNFYTKTSRRTFGKPVETDESKKLNNGDFLQIQKVEIQSQDERLQELHQIIARQKQLGITVNEELSIQNELLDGLDKHIDKSADRLNIAKSKVKKFT